LVALVLAYLRAGLERNAFFVTINAILSCVYLYFMRSRLAWWQWERQEGVPHCRPSRWTGLSRRGRLSSGAPTCSGWRASDDRGPEGARPCLDGVERHRAARRVDEVETILERIRQFAADRANQTAGGGSKR
jgi:hypothetical protein